MARKKKVSLRLAEVLKEKDITKYKFAKLLGKSTSNVSVYFKKDYRPNLATLERWAEVLDCRVTELIEED
jgi:transcriptional regulator with XRE-family HTH domain